MNTARPRSVNELSSTRPESRQSRPYTRQTSASRPWTAQSRPGTARPQTAASTMHDASFVIALIESRGIAHEVGMAALDKDTGRVMLIQLSDCSTYVKTLHQMHVHTPYVILVPDTFLSSTNTSLNPSASATRGASSASLSVQFIREEFPQVPLEPVPRKYWNDSAGYQFVAQFCVEDDERAATLVSVTDKYYTLSAACALFKFVETRLNTRFSACSLRIRYIPVEGTMMIDPETVRNLELINNQTRKKSTHSLFGVLNYTYTAMATRLLRTNILAPLTGKCLPQSALSARLDAVEELIHSEDKFTEIKDALKVLNKMDFDKLISSLGFSEVRPTTTAKGAFSRVSQILSLRTAIRSLPFLQRALNGCKSQLLLIIYDILSDERLTKIEKLIAENLNDDAGPVKGGIGAINARVYAVKANRNRLLDVARGTFKENVADIYQLNHALSERYSLPLTLVYQESGFVFALKKDELEDELPKGFINVSTQRGRWLFSSMDLKKMNARMKDSLEETLVLSDKIIRDVVEQIIAFSGVLYSASEAVATIDLLWSFAHVSIMRSYVRPEFTDTLAIKSGRHPILETVQSAGMVVSNDIYCSDAAHFHIVQGPNMSGKSTYLRQTGLLTVMAMVGCFVPAEYASFRLHDALLTRLSNDDDIEKSLSTFANEMTSSAMILGIATPRTLVLIDELGRGTSPIEGLGIAHAIAEDLVKLKCFVLFATHFHELSITLSRQPAVVNLHLSVQRSRPSASNFGLTFQYKILDGVPENTGHYGLELAKLADLPDDVLTEARRVSEIITEKNLRCEEESRINILTIRRRALLKLHAQLNQALDHSSLPEEELVAYLARLQRDFMKTLKDTL
ncbi:muts domain V-domain-containing protein [Suillus americanus]|nr:muts domain V-domain-containing protein [Suillus americanus]